MAELQLDDYVRKVPDFPKPGIIFYDVTGIITTPKAFAWVIDKMCELYANKGINAVAAIEARGFLFAAPFAYKMGLPLIVVRKKGKLPGKTLCKSYDLEYGSAELEIHVSDIKAGDNVLLMDDLIATGGTLGAARELLQRCGATVTAIFGVMGLPILHYEQVLAGTPVTTLINYDSE
jgi:adenine phosphoribosyltransferase